MSTCRWLCTRFGDGARLNGEQFCQLAAYLRVLKGQFEEIDANHDGSIDCDELFMAFLMSGVQVEASVVRRFGQSLDADKNGALEFDEFVQMKLECDRYMELWAVAAAGGATIHLQQLHAILEGLKRSVEPVGSLLAPSMRVPRLFEEQTCQKLMLRFGDGRLQMSFSSFLAMLVFLKEATVAFSEADAARSGCLNVEGLGRACASLGMALPTELVVEIGRSVDHDRSGAIEFDEFLQIAVGWHSVCEQQALFLAQSTGRLSATNLQELFGQVRVVYHAWHGQAQAVRRFSLNTCRWLVARFGTALPGEQAAEGVTWPDFLQLIHFVKEAYAKYVACDIFENGAINAHELSVAFKACGVPLPDDVVERSFRAFDTDDSGRLEFDEFLQLLVTCTAASGLARA